MKIAAKFSLFVAIPAIIICGLLYILKEIEYSTLLSVIIAGVLGVSNIFASIILFKISIKKSNAGFLKFNLGGMVVRLFVNILVVIIVLNFLNIDQVAFILVFFIFYFIGISFEIVFFHKYPYKK